MDLLAIASGVAQGTFQLAQEEGTASGLQINLFWVIVSSLNFIFFAVLLYWLFGAILLVGRLGWRRNFIRQLLGPQLTLPEFAWDRLLWAWVGFFLATGALNIFVAFTYSTDTWVNFKLFGLMGMTLVFTIAVGLWLARHIDEEAPSGK